MEPLSLVKSSPIFHGRYTCPVRGYYFLANESLGKVRGPPRGQIIIRNGWPTSCKAWYAFVLLVCEGNTREPPDSVKPT